MHMNDYMVRTVEFLEIKSDHTWSLHDSYLFQKQDKKHGKHREIQAVAIRFLATICLKGTYLCVGQPERFRRVTLAFSV